MSFKDKLTEIFQQYKEAELNTSKDLPKDIFSKSKSEIIDGLVNTFDGDEELALQALNKHLNKMDDGYKEKNPQIVAAKNELEDIIESKKVEAAELDLQNNTSYAKDDANDIKAALDVENSGLNESKFRKIVNSLLKEYHGDYEKPERAEQDSFVLKDRDAARSEEMYAYAMNGIHPNFDYEKPMLRAIHNGRKFVFVIDGIDKNQDKGPKDTYVYVRPVFQKRSENGKWVRYYGELEAINVETILNILHDDLNADVYEKTLGNDPDDPEIWMDNINHANKNRKESFLRWYVDNKDILDLDGFSKITIQKIYQDITKYGYSTEEALARHEKERKKDESIDEAREKLDLVKDPTQLKKIVSELGINPDFVELPMHIIYPDMGDDTEPPVNFVIVGAPKTSEIKELYVKDWDKGGRSYTMDVDTILQIQDRPENQNPEPDLWDFASTMNKQHRSLNKGTVGKWRELTKNEVIDALTEMEKRDEFKGVSLVKKYLAPQTFETRNPLVGKALKMLDPDIAVKPTKNKNGFNGFCYQIFIPDDGKSRPPAHGHSNAYKDLVTTW